jgi:hypothetical protein
VDLSKWKLDVYDLLAIILPGLIAIGEGWVLIGGWDSFCLAIAQLTATGLTLLILASFAAGTLIQELGDFVMKSFKGDRFFRSGRDKFWSSKKAEPVKVAIRSHLGTAVGSVDTAFDYCLTKLKGQFPKRDLFVATSDLCRSFAVLALIALAPALWNEFHVFGLSKKFVAWATGSVLVSLFLYGLSWRRMVRFRELSDVTVFRAYLATVSDPNNEASEETEKPAELELDLANGK